MPKTGDGFFRFIKTMAFTAAVLICTAAKAQVKDTVFIKRIQADTPYPFYNAIYIDTAKAVVDFSFSNFDATAFFRDLKDLPPIRKKINVPEGLPSKWVRLYKYKNAWYTYLPSEAGENYKFKITDSVSIDYIMEGAAPSKINSITKIAPGQYLINRTNPWQGKAVKINIVDPKKGIAVFSFGKTKYRKTGYQLLMVSADKAHLFKTIINFCKTQKVEELDFDKIDFARLEF